MHQRIISGLPKADRLALVCVAACCAVAFGCAALLQMSWDPPLWRMLLAPAGLLLVAFAYRRLKPDETRLSQIPLYIALWLAASVAGVQLTFITNTLNFPLQSETFFAMDRALGFDWAEWAKFNFANPWLAQFSSLAYKSHVFQPVAAVLIVAFFGPRDRNANLVITKLIALALMLAISAVLPALEPGYYYGYNTPAAEAMIALREGQRMDLQYIGIVCFPSFHTVMAVIYVTVYRGMPIPLAISLVINLCMLFSIPFAGDHYLVDVIAGFALALFAQWLATKITRRMRRSEHEVA